MYNAEYVNLTGNNLKNIKGALVKLYRGGSDESTFGPHLFMSNNTVESLGLGKRNQSKASLFLHGVQVTNIAHNKVLNSAPIIIEHTVGEPVTRISDNTLSETPSVVELRAKGDHTAKLVNNKVLKQGL